VRVDRFHEYLAADLPDDEMQVLAVSQRPVAELALLEAATESAWLSKPTWAIVAAADKIIDPELQRYTSTRAAARGILELDAPHLVMQTHPAEVEAVITGALEELLTRPSVKVAPGRHEPS
jgi:pimeloyl-ACP methyl ester carboxylesterase